MGAELANRACVWAWVMTALLGLSLHAADGTGDVSFESRDVVVRMRESLGILRDGKLVASFGEPWCIGADEGGRLWAGSAEDGRIRLRCYTSTGRHEEFATEPICEDIVLHKVLHWRGSPHLAYAIPHEEGVTGPWTEGKSTEGRVSGQWVHVLSFDAATRTFRRPIPLTNFLGQSELILPGRKLTDGRAMPRGVRDTALLLGLFDAAVTPSGTLWLSTQGKLTSYRIGGLPIGLTKLLDPAKIEGLGRRTGKIDWWISRHGNGTGVAALSETTLVVVNGNPPGGLTLVDTVEPRDSVPLTRSVFPGDPGEWGLCPVLDVGEDILVAHRHSKVAKVYRVSKATGAVSVFASDVVARQMTLIRSWRGTDDRTQ